MAAGDEMQPQFSGIRLGVTGGRHYTDMDRVFAALNMIHAEFRIKTLIEGGADGLDSLAHEWAKAHDVQIETYDADWDKHGRAAGPIRNAKMAEVIDALAAFPGGAGTASMKREAAKRGKVIYEF